MVLTNGADDALLLLPAVSPHSNENTKTEDGQVRFLIYCLEHAARLADEQRECGVAGWLLGGAEVWDGCGRVERVLGV